jgi:hypothetical protein
MCDAAIQTKRSPTWSEAKTELHAEYPQLRREYVRLGPAFAIHGTLIRARNVALAIRAALGGRP